MVYIYFLNKFKNNKLLNILPLFAILSFTTWYINTSETFNMILYGLILIVLAIFKAKDITLIMFSLFSVLGNREYSFLENFDKFYLKLFNKNISALRSYYTFLYTFIFSLLIIILLIRLIKRRKKESMNLLRPMIAIIIYSLITLFWTFNLSTGLSEIWFIVQGYFIYYVIRSNNYKKNYFYEISWFLSLMLLVLSLEYFVSYSEYFSKRDISLSFFKYYTYHSKSPINLWANPNVVASLFGISFIPSLYKYFSKRRSIINYLFIPFELLIIYGIILSKSKGLYYAFLIGLLFIPFLFIKNKKLLYTLIITGIFMFVLMFGTLIYLEDIYPELYLKLNDFTTKRIDIYKEALKLLKNPTTLIFGKGVGSDRHILNVSFFHSFIFQILVTRGLIGLIFYCVIFYYVVEMLFISKGKFRYFVALATIIYLAHGITDSGFEYQYIGVIFYILYGSLENSIKGNDDLLIE